MIRLVIAAAVWLAAATQGFAEPPRLTVWAWERPEDLRFLPTDVDIAVQSGFIVLAGDTMTSRSRRFPLFANPQQVTTSVVHLQIDHRKPLDWTPQLRARTAAAVVQLARSVDVRQVQIDFEVRASEHQILRDVVTHVRAALSPAATTTASGRTGQTVASAVRSAGGGDPGAKPAETMPLAPAATKAFTAVPSEPG